MNSFYDSDELANLGLKRYGNNVLLSRYTQIYNPEMLSIGDNVRIDDFCILSGNIILGSNIHISAYCALYGSYGILIDDYSGLSARATLYSAMDDFSGNYLIGPIHPKSKTNVITGVVHIKKFVQVGADSLVFPNVTIEEGCVIGAMSMIKRNTTPWGVYAGIPARRIKTRENQLLNLL